MNSVFFYIIIIVICSIVSTIGIGQIYFRLSILSEEKKEPIRFTYRRFFRATDQEIENLGKDGWELVCISENNWYFKKRV